VPSATAILDRFLHHAEVIQISGKSYRLANREKAPKETKAPTGSVDSKDTKAPTGSAADEKPRK
jgi:IstB-like ATP binding protein